MLTDEQKEERLNYLTGTDAAVICGMSPYKNIVTLWLEKTRRTETPEVSGNIIKFGNYMEDGIAQWFSDESGIKLKPKPELMPGKVIPIRVHPKYKWMAGNCDYELEGVSAILECKSAGRPGDEWGDAENIIPAHYLMQVAHYAAVFNVDVVYIAVVFSFTRELRIYTYERNENLEERLIEKENNFWHNHVLADVPPEPTTQDEVISLYKETKDDIYPATAEIEDAVYQLARLKNQIKELEKTEQRLKDEIGVYMGEHERLVDCNGQSLVDWRMSKPVKSFDSKRLLADNPELYNKYITMREPRRTFRLKAKG